MRWLWSKSLSVLLGSKAPFSPMLKGLGKDLRGGHRELSGASGTVCSHLIYSSCSVVSVISVTGSSQDPLLTLSLSREAPSLTVF